MAILGFKKRFVGKIKNGRKRQTIRKFRKYPITPGETLYLYTALRTKYAQKIREVICKWVYGISISLNNNWILIVGGPCGEQVKLTGINALNKFAKADGFKDWEDMKAFWLAEHGVKKGKRKVILKKFVGTLTTW
jgi:hypothetical protein